MIARRPIRRVTARGVEDTEDALAVERWVRLTLNGREVAAVMASPGRERELGAGFALTQGFVRRRGELLSVTVRADAQGQPVVRIIVPLELSLAAGERATARGSCGGILHAGELPTIEGDHPLVAGERLREMARTMSLAQEAYRRTGGTHGAAIFTPDADLVVVCEDVGRHNATDKAVGHCLLNDLPLRDKVLLVSGRISQEIAAKAIRAGIAIIASTSAPTAAGAALADGHGLTAVGFLRGRRMNIYAHPQRIDLAAPSSSGAREL